MKKWKWTALILAAALILGLIAPMGAMAEEEEKDYLEGMHIVYLGADYFAGDGEQLAEEIAALENGTYVMDAVEGAALVGEDAASYVTRAGMLEQSLDSEAKNLLLVELTGNDLENGTPIGTWEYGADAEQDTGTIAGALESIFRKARELEMTAALLIPAEQESPEFLQIMQTAKDLQEKWGYALIDLSGMISTEDVDAATSDDVAETIISALKPWLTVMRGNYKNMFKYAGNLPQFDPETYPVDADSPLAGLNIIQLGSSVTEGTGTDAGISFVEYIAQMTGSTYIKEAVPGTTMSNYAPLGEETSYLYRMEHNIDPEAHADLFLCQLSTNDASKRVEVGEVSASDDPADFNLETVAGAAEYIIHYAKDTWGCPVMFYTGTEYSNAAYGDMVDMLLSLQDKYDIGIIDMYHGLSTDIPLYDQYMSPDGIHPTKRGYAEWWAPYMIESITEYLGTETAAADAANANDDGQAVETASADAAASDSSIDITCETGSVTVKYYDGSEILQSEDAGNILVQVPEGTVLDNIQIYSSAGEIDIYGVIADSYDLETVHDDMNVYLPEDQAFHLQITTISDLFESDFLYDVGMERHEYYFGEDGVDIVMETIVGTARVMILP